MLGPTRRVRVLALVAALLGASLASDDGTVVLDLDTLEARMDGSTLHASGIAGAHVGAIDDAGGYLFGREVGVWLGGRTSRRRGDVFLGRRGGWDRGDDEGW